MKLAEAKRRHDLTWNRTVRQRRAVMSVTDRAMRSAQCASMEADAIRGVEEDVWLADVPPPPAVIRIPNGGELNASPCGALNLIVEHVVYYHEENVAHVLFSRVIAYNPETRRHVLARLEARAVGSEQVAAFTQEELECTPDGFYEFELQNECLLTDVDVASMTAPPPAHLSAFQMYKKIKTNWRFRVDLTN